MTAPTPPTPAAGGVITIRRPHVPHGPAHLTADQADVDYLLKAARDLEGFYRPFGSNLRATIVQLIRDAAAAIGNPDAPPAAPAVGVDREALAEVLSRSRHPMRWEYRVTSTVQDEDYTQADAVLEFLASQPVDADAVERTARALDVTDRWDYAWWGAEHFGDTRTPDERREAYRDGLRTTARAALAAARAGVGGVTAEQVGHFLSEVLDDDAPLNEQRYVRTAESLARRYPALGIEVQR